MLYLNKIKELREKKQLTQKQVASELNMHLTTYTRYERGEQDLPLHTAIIIAKYFNVSLDTLSGIENEEFKKREQPLQCVLGNNQSEHTL